jgi:nucleoside-diphosphate-sugar epimerase
MTTPNLDAAPRIAVVTGAAGFIGQHLCRGLLAAGWTVRAIDLDARPGIPEHPALQFQAMDIRDESSLEETLGGADTVFHLASAHLQLNAPSGWYESINVDAVGFLVAACARTGIRRLVHTSSVGVYGDVRNPPADEDSAKNPVSEYERTKLMGESAAFDGAKLHGVELIVLRPGWVYGSGCARTAKLLRTIQRGRFLYVGGGANLRHPIHIDDAIDAFLRAADAPASACGRPFLIVGPRAVSVRELVEECADVLGVSRPSLSMPRALMLLLTGTVELAFKMLRREPPISRRSLAFFENNNSFDGQAAAKQLGFRPRFDLNDGLRRTAMALQMPTTEPSH